MRSASTNLNLKGPGADEANPSRPGDQPTVQLTGGAIRSIRLNFKLTGAKAGRERASGLASLVTVRSESARYGHWPQAGPGDDCPTPVIERARWQNLKGRMRLPLSRMRPRGRVRDNGRHAARGPLRARTRVRAWCLVRPFLAAGGEPPGRAWRRYASSSPWPFRGACFSDCPTRAGRASSNDAASTRASRRASPTIPGRGACGRALLQSAEHSSGSKQIYEDRRPMARLLNMKFCIMG
jgi:hypothetical protein